MLAISHPCPRTPCRGTLTQTLDGWACTLCSRVAIPASVESVVASAAYLASNPPAEASGRVRHGSRCGVTREEARG